MAFSLYFTIPKQPLSSNFIFSKTPSLFPSILHRHSGYFTWVSAISSSVAETNEHHFASPGLVAKEYAELNLADKFCEEIGSLRVRQHVNPLRRSLMIPAEVPNWKEMFRDATLPLMVDIGSGSGRFLMWLAKRNSSSMNYLGLEIRLKCPDPHFKKKHHKRRVVQKPLVESIVNNLANEGQVFIQSDVLEVALDMRNYFDAASDKLVHIDSFDPSLPCDGDGWVLKNPMGIRTEREIHAEFEGCRIYRRVYQKVQH